MGRSVVYVLVESGGPEITFAKTFVILLYLSKQVVK